MKLIGVMMLVVLCSAMKAQDLKEKYKNADGYRQKYNAGYFYGDVTPQWIGDGHCFW